MTWRAAVAALLLVASSAAMVQSRQEPDAATRRGAVLDSAAFPYQRHIPAGEPGLVTLTLDAAVLAHSQGPFRTFADVRIVDENGAQVPYLLERRPDRLSLDLSLTPAEPQSPELREQRPGRQRSFHRVALPYENLPGVVIELQGAARVFRRPLRLGVERPPEERRRETTFETLAEVVWEHTDPSTVPPPLELAVPRERSRDLLLVVEEGDNEALPIRTARLRLPGWQLRFFRPAGALRLVYGRRDLVEPQYDIALLRAELSGQPAREVTAGAETPVEAPPPVVSPRLFWIGLAAAAAMLLLLLVRLLSSRG